MNILVRKRSRTKTQPGDVFDIHLKNDSQLIGLVVRHDVPIWFGQAKANLIYIFKDARRDAEGVWVLERDRLLIPPKIVEDPFFTRGYFQIIGRVELTDQNSFPDHCLYQGRTFRNDRGETVPERFEPAIVDAISTPYTIDEAISAALGIPFTEDD